MSEKYDVQQVCENGHQITGRFDTEEGRRQKFCKDCGAKTIVKCPNCNKAIQGDMFAPIGAGGGFVPVYPANVPSYCPDCGEPYPWTPRKIAAAIQILTEFGNLDEEEKKTIEQDINNIAKDVPQAELSAMRIKRIWEKCSRAGYEIIMELASRTAANILKGQ